MSENVQAPKPRPPGLRAPWKPGQSGNPTGRTRDLALLQAEIERTHAGPLAMEALERLRNIGMGKVLFPAGRGTKATNPAKDMVQVMALTAYLDRVGVVPKKAKEDDGAQLGDMTADEMDEMAAELARRAGAKRAEVS